MIGPMPHPPNLEDSELSPGKGRRGEGRGGEGRGGEKSSCFTVIYSQLSPCGHFTITDTPLVWTAAEVLQNKKLLKTTHAVTDFLY